LECAVAEGVESEDASEGVCGDVVLEGGDPEDPEDAAACACGEDGGEEERIGSVRGEGCEFSGGGE